MLGDIDLTANFGASTFTGTMDTINVFGGAAIPDQTLGGSMTLSGTITGTTLSGTGSGSLSAVTGGAKITDNASATIAGQFEDFFAFHDAISGTLDLNTGAIGISETGVPFYGQ